MSKDRERFTYFYEQYYASMRRFVLSITGDQDATDDVLQEIWRTLWAQPWKLIGSLRDHEGIRAYLFGMAKQEVRRFRRDKGRDKHFFSEDLSDVLASEGAANCEEESSRLEKLQYCMARLTKDEHEIIFPKGAVKELAFELKTTEGALSQRRSRIRKKLLTCMNRASN